MSDLAEFCERVARADSFDDAECLWALIDLMRSAPDDVLEAFGLGGGWTELDRLLAEGATETVAIRLIGELPGFMISRGEGDSFLASLALPALVDEVDAHGRSLVQAIASVIALATIRLLTA